MLLASPFLYNAVLLQKSLLYLFISNLYVPSPLWVVLDFFVDILPEEG
jgi:hypothetical protein